MKRTVQDYQTFDNSLPQGRLRLKAKQLSKKWGTIENKKNQTPKTGICQKWPEMSGLPCCADTHSLWRGLVMRKWGLQPTASVNLPTMWEVTLEGHPPAAPLMREVKPELTCWTPKFLNHRNCNFLINQECSVWPNCEDSELGKKVIQNKKVFSNLIDGTGGHYLK